MTAKKILLVDDSAMARRSARQILESAGYAVAEAEDGLIALERYFLEKPDLVLLDLVMKGMNGLDVLSKLTRNGRRRARDRGVRRRAGLVATSLPQKPAARRLSHQADRSKRSC